MTKQVLKSMKNFSLTLLVSLAIPQAVLAATTLTFDDYSDGTVLSTEYQSLGVTTSGATVSLAIFTRWPAVSGSNLVLGLTGLITFNFDSSITGNIKTVSAYVSGDPGTGIFAYDSSGALLGQSQMPLSSVNAFLSVTSSGNPIARVEIHDGGGTFGVDDFSFSQAPPAPTCSQVSQQLSDGIVALANSDFKSGNVASKRAKLKSGVTNFQSLLAVNSSPAQLLFQLNKIKYDINDWIRPGTKRTNLLNLVDQLIAKVNAGQC